MWKCQKRIWEEKTLVSIHTSILLLFGTLKSGLNETLLGPSTNQINAPLG